MNKIIVLGWLIFSVGLSLAQVESDLPIKEIDWRLADIAEDTFAYLSSDWATAHNLPYSWRSEQDIGGTDYGNWINVTEIGLYTLCWLGAYELHQPWSPSWDETKTVINNILDQLACWQDSKADSYQQSVFYQWYLLDQLSVGRRDVDQLVPSIDNAFLALALIAVSEYGQAGQSEEISARAEDILVKMDFRLWFNNQTALFSLGGRHNPLAGIPGDYYANENRIVNFIARALGQITADEFRASLEMLNRPAGQFINISVPWMSWDGSLFTYLAPGLFIDEGQTGFWQNSAVPAVNSQIAYAKALDYGSWGFSDCFNIGAGDYIGSGALPMASPNPPEDRPGVTAPHASALALIIPELKEEAIANLLNLKNNFPDCYEPGCGFLDSVITNPEDQFYGQASQRFSVIAQEWIFLAIAESEANLLKNYLYRHPGVVMATAEMF